MSDLVALAHQGLAHHKGTRHTRLSSRRRRQAAATAHGSPSAGLVPGGKLYDGANGGQAGAAPQLGPRGGSPPQPRGGRRRRAAGVRARGERREAGQHHAPPRLRGHLLRGHAAQRDRARAGARTGGGARRRRHRARGGARDAPRRRREHEPRASRCCWRRSRARRCSAGRCASAPRRCWTRSRWTTREPPTRRSARPGRAASTSPSSTTCAPRPRIALRDAMAAAAGRDSVAAEYATGYAVTFELGLPALARALDDGLGPRAATVELYLALLAAVPDTLIARKRGRARRGARVGRRGPGAGRRRRPRDAGRAASRRSTPRCGRTATRSTPARRPTW